MGILNIPYYTSLMRRDAARHKSGNPRSSSCRIALHRIMSRKYVRVHLKYLYQIFFCRIGEMCFWLYIVFLVYNCLVMNHFFPFWLKNKRKHLFPLKTHSVHFNTIIFQFIDLLFSNLWGYRCSISRWIFCCF